MKQLTAALLFFVFLFSACNKNKDAGDVQIRIENSTDLLLEDVKIGDAIYGNVANGTTTDYAVVATPIYSGYCNFKLNHQETGAGNGICGTPPPPQFAAGRYTFKVEQVAQDYFTVVVIKE